MATSTRPFNPWDGLKRLGLALMVVDHIGLLFFPDQPEWRAVGRSAAAVFLFLAGYASSFQLRRDQRPLAGQPAPAAAGRPRVFYTPGMAGHRPRGRVP